MLPCGSSGAHPVLCLDVCGGYAGKLPGYDQYLYRYYMAGSTATGECSSTVENAGACAREEGMTIIVLLCAALCMNFVTTPSKSCCDHSLELQRGFTVQFFFRMTTKLAIDCVLFAFFILPAKCCISSTPPSTLRPYSIGCFRGCPLNNAILTNNEINPDLGAYKHCRASGILGTTGDFVPMVSNFVTEVNVNSSLQMFVVEEEEVPSGGNGEFICYCLC